MHPIEPYARTAYAMGWAASGGPMTDRVQAGCVAAIQYAQDHEHDPAVLEATLRLGHMEGVWASIFARRTQLYADNTAKVERAWKLLVSSLDLPAIVKAVRAQAGVTEKDRDKTTTAYASLLVLNALAGAIGTKQWNTLRDELQAALNAGLGEGQAGAMALLADTISQSTGFDFDRAFADAKQELGADNPFLVSVDNWLSQLMDVVSTYIGGVLAQSIADDDDYDDMLDEFGDELSDPKRPMSYIIDQLTHLAISAGILWFYRRNGVANIWFITVGDEAVCPMCDDAEATSPYEISDVPTPPLHPNCRCSLYTDDSMSSDLIDGYLV